MLLPIGQSLDLDVTLVRATPSPLVSTAKLIFFDGQAYTLHIGEAARSLEDGNSVVLDFGTDGPSRCRATICGIEGESIRLRPREPLQRKDRRDYPRVVGELPFEFRPLGLAQQTPKGREQLLQRFHLTDTSRERFRVPDPFVDLSATGLRFIDTQPCDEGELLLIRCQIAPESQWRGIVAEVVRIEEEVPNEWSIAVAFLDMTDGAFDVLLDYIGDRQRKLLGI